MSREVFEAFGPFHLRLKLEVNVILLRAYILGGFKLLPEYLDDDRVNGGNTCRISDAKVDFEQWRKQTIWSHRESYVAYRQFLWDMQHPASD